VVDIGVESELVPERGEVLGAGAMTSVGSRHTRRW
jgi:hypothetical protein